jgi:hypothetical protein
MSPRLARVSLPPVVVLLLVIRCRYANIKPAVEDILFKTRESMRAPKEA